jgi:hypothetical protein
VNHSPTGSDLTRMVRRRFGDPVHNLMEAELKKFRSLLAAMASLAMLSAFAFSSATNVYITPDGSSQGVCTTSPQTPAWFNSSSNWGSGASQIGPGTTVHLCGTFTGSAGADGFLLFQSSGASGNPITLFFESNTVVQAPYWGTNNGAISTNGNSYIVIDGGSNGILAATANGSGLANQQDGKGVVAIGCNNCAIQNLTIANLYIHNSLNDAQGQNTYATYVVGGNNFTLQNNTVHDAKMCLFYAYTASSNLTVAGNTSYDCDHNLAVGAANTNNTLVGLSVHDNTFHDWTNWDDTQDSNHHDGIHIWATSQGAAITGTYSIYNNYIYGDVGIHMTAMVFIEANSGGSQAGYNGFNNIFVSTNASHNPGNGLIYTQVGNCGWYNNTMVSATTQTGNAFDFAATSCSTKNNIVSNVATGIYLESGNSLTASNTNNCHDLNGSGNAMVYHTTFYGTVPAWSSATGYDAQSVTGDPNLSASWLLQSPSAAIGSGTNLTSLGIAALDSDKAGTARAGSGAWDMGAYVYGATQKPVPPTGLTASVH